MDGVGILEEGTFVTANAELARCFGFDGSADVVGTSWEELYPPAGRERIENELLPRVRADGGRRGEVAGLRTDGSTFPQRLVIRSAEGGRLVWIVRDQSSIPDRSPVERATPESAPVRGNGRGSSGTHADGDPGSESTRPRSAPPHVRPEGVGPDEDRVRSIVESVPVPLVVCTRERGIVEANRRAIELASAEDVDEVLGIGPEEFVHPEDRERARRRFRLAVEDRERSDPAEYRLIDSDAGERFAEMAAEPVTWRGEPAAFVIVDDVTSLRRAQEKLRLERRFLETAIDSVDDIVYVIDEDGEPYLWNEALAETTGYDHEEIGSMDPAAFLPEDQHEYVPGLMEAIDSLEDRRVELDVLTKDGETIEHEFRGTTFEDPETGEVFRCGIARDVSERLERERRLERYETIVETIDDGIYALDDDLRFSFVNEGLCEMLGRSREELLGRSVRGLFAFDDELEFADEIRRRIVEGDDGTGIVRGTYPTGDGDRIFESRYRLLPGPDGEFRGSAGVVRDVTGREERKRELESRLDELETLDRINRILRKATRELVESADRRAIEQIVCSQLVDSELYEFAWVGEQTFDGDRVVPRTTAGDDRGYLDELEPTADGGATDGGPADLTMRTRDVRTASGDGSGDCRWPDGADECGFGSIAAVPLHHEETVYGVLMVHTTREDAFGDRVRNDLDVLGRTVGFVINAVRSHELLFTDNVVEFELLLSGETSVFGTVASAVECELELAGFVASGQRWILYVDVYGGRPDDVVDLATDQPTVERARVIRESDSGGRLELVVTAPSLVPTVSNAGASVRSVSADRRGVRLVAEAPVDSDVRDIVEPIQREFPETTLEARRDRDREVTTVEHPNGTLDDLTARQREALEAAYRAGYFAWPRDSTANEVAESLDIASATLHGHLRKAEAAILSTVFEGE